MESILKNLQDPSWWFTAIFAAFIIGVGAGFVRERLLYPILAAVSERFKKRRTERVEAVEKMIAALAANPEFMILTFLRLLFLLVLWVGMWVLMALLVVVTIPQYQNAGARPFPFLLQPIGDPEWTLFLVGLVSVFLGFFAYLLLSQASKVMIACARYQRDRGLPPVFVSGAKNAIERRDS